MLYNIACMTRVGFPSGAQETFSPSPNKCCADSLSVCPTPVCVGYTHAQRELLLRTHAKDPAVHVRVRRRITKTGKADRPSMQYL